MANSLMLLQRHLKITCTRALSIATAPKLRVFQSSTFNPFFNIATEEYIFNNMDPKDTHTLFLWRNEPTVMIGRHQNPWKECYLDNMKRDGVHLVRRHSGGGAVYMDSGNTCFTFMSPIACHNKDLNSNIVIRALKPWVNAEISGRNDMTVDGKKFSGAAFKLSADRAFHHGTLLINVDMSSMGKYLNPNKAKLQSKGVDSVAARVVNLQELDKNIRHEHLCDNIIQQFFSQYNSTCPVETLDTEQLKKIPELHKHYKHLQDWNWRFGNTPHFTHEFETRFDWGIMDCCLNCKDGKVQSMAIYSDSLNPQFIDEIKSQFRGVSYDSQGIKQACRRVLDSTDNSQSQEQIKEFERWLLQQI